MKRSTYERNIRRIFAVGSMNIPLAIQILVRHYGISSRTAKRHIYRYLTNG